MLTLSPTFGSYASHARQIGCEAHHIALDPAQGFALPVENMLEQSADYGVKLVVICAPNNPTGTLFPYEQLRQVVTQSDAFVLLDAAYAEFSGQDLRPLLAESDKVVLVHTLSKAFALAGVRVGYALSSPEVAGELQKLVTTFTLSPFSESAAIIALENRDRFQPLIDAIVTERERMATALAQLPGITVYPSATNFLLVHLGYAGKKAQGYLRRNQRVLVTDMGMYPGYEDYLRISIGTPEQNKLVVTGLADFLATI
jgi:histidinol-phosphate aminotransferase